MLVSLLTGEREKDIQRYATVDGEFDGRAQFPGGGRYLVQEDSLGEIRLELVLEAKGLFVAKSRAIGNTI